MVNLNKPAEQIVKSGKQAEANQKDNSGLDPVLAKLSYEITKKLFVNSSNGLNVASMSQTVNCPKCGKIVKNASRICSCGEALQCSRCRGINYEKPDPFLCKDCGTSKYMMFDFTLKCSEGNAVDPVETEDMRKAAEEQVETNL